MRHGFTTHRLLSCLVLLCCACASTERGPDLAGDRAAGTADPEARKLAPTPKEIAAAADAAFRAQDWGVAEGTYERLLDFEPEQSSAWMRLGYCRHMQRKYPAAIEAFEHVQSGPEMKVARYNTACALALQGKTEASLDALDRAIEAGFNDMKALTEDPDLASLRSCERYSAALLKVASATPKPFEPAHESHQFDFWIGDWDVLTTTGAQAGTSRIERILNGCALLENWSSAKGNHGKSFNVYDPKKKEWRQHWIDDSGTETFYAGAFADNCMTLTSEERTADGKRKLHRMRFFDLGSEGVRQWGEVSPDDGANWTTEFDLFYRRK